MKAYQSLAFTLLLAILAVLVSILVYGKLPEMIAIHWNVNGEPDGLAPKSVAVFAIPLFILLLPFLFRVARYAKPRQEEAASSATAISATIAVTAVILFIVHATILFAALGYSINVPKIAITCTGSMLLVMGSYIGKTGRNSMIGIRNRWTLNNEKVWARTHRLASWLFMANGACMLAVAVFGRVSAVEGMWLLTFLAVTLVVTQAYSYKLWRKDCVGKR